MPELPECETNRRRVQAEALNRTIEGVDLYNTEYIELPGSNARQRLVGRQFTTTRRHGKMIFAGSQTGPWIAVHLGMTGSLRPFDGDDMPKYAKMVIRFEGERRLAFVCPRKLGWVKVIDDPEAEIAERSLGPDALEIEAGAFAQSVGTSRGAIKSMLMDQGKLAGVGNLWSDETCFQTGTMPDSRANDLPEGRVGEIHGAMQRIMGRVCDVEGRYSKLPADWLIRHRDVGQTCRLCGGTIQKKKVGGRTAYFCPDHQG